MATMNSTNCNDSSLAVSVQTLGEQCSRDFITRVFYDFLQMFYIVFPSEENYENGHDVPNYEINLIPMASFFIVMEQVVRLYQKKDLTRLQDFVTNLGSAIIFLFSRILFLGMILHVYIYIYENYRIVDLPLNSIWTWLVSLLLVEFVYYWTHRALHEFNILWAAHQFHHMAEDLNITTAVRDSVVDLILYDIFPLPLSLLIPPQILVVHMQFSLIYQIWLHNSVVGDLGFIEYIVNTPRQHLVHHGKNPYCIDKNYGALLMIFDRMFGTYQKEQKEDKLVFGVVSPLPSTFDPMKLQFGYYRDVYNKFVKMDNIGDKVSALLKGPGWSPGKPRLGLISDIPEPDRDAPKYSYDPVTPIWIKLYVAMHGFILFMGFYFIGHHTLIRFSYAKALAAMLYIILTLTSFGMIFDFRKMAPLFESSRCLVYYLLDYYIVVNTPWVLGSGEKVIFDIFITSIRIIHLASIVFWIIRMFTQNDHRTHSVANEEKDNQKDTKEKENNNGFNLNGNIESVTIDPKANKRANNTKQISLYNLIAAVAFIMVAFAVLDILYFVKVDSCSQFVNQLKNEQ